MAVPARFRNAWLVAVTAALLLALLLALPGRDGAALAEEGPSAGVQVSATGSVVAKPDVVRLALAAEATRPKAAAALTAATASARAMGAALKAAGVAPADLQTSGLQVNPSWGRNGKITGYVARQQVSAVVRAVSDAGRAVDAASAAGGDAFRVDSLRYEVDDDEALLTQAREEALALAQARAQTYASAAGRSLGSLVEVVEGSGSGQQGGVDGNAYPAAASSADRGVGLEPGSLEVSVTVQARWALG